MTLLVDREHDPQTVPEPDALDVEIHPLSLELRPQRHELIGRRRQRMAQERGEVEEHALGVGRARETDETRERVQRVEQEMRMDLELQRLELSGIRRVRRRGDAPLLLAQHLRVAERGVEARPRDEDPEEEAEREDELPAVEEELRMGEIVRGQA